MDSNGILKFHASYFVEGEKVRLTTELITGDPQTLDIEAVFLDSQVVYRGFMTDEMCDVGTVLSMLKMNRASLSLVEEGLLLRCPPIKILLTPSEEELDVKQLRIEMLEEKIEELNKTLQKVQVRLKKVEERAGSEAPQPFENRSELLTFHVWPKSRMLLSIVSRMLKEGLLSRRQKGRLKDLILEEDSHMLKCLQQYEMDGNRKQLYSSFLEIASQ